MSFQSFIPSAESLSIFDELKREVDAERRDALASVGATVSNTADSSNEVVGQGANGNIPNGRRCATSSNLRRENSNARRPPQPPRGASTARPPRAATSNPALWVVRSRGDMCPRPIGTSFPARWEARAHREVVVSAENTLWLKRLKEFHHQLNGEAPDDLDVWNRDHIPFQLRSTRPSPASGASNGWELSEVMVREVRKQMRRAREEVPQERARTKRWFVFRSWVSEKLLSIVGAFKSAVSGMVSRFAARLKCLGIG